MLRVDERKDLPSRRGVVIFVGPNLGAVAQLGERFVRNEEVASSILVSSILEKIA